MNSAELLAQLAPGELKIFSETKLTRVDGQQDVSEKTYLQFEGTPNALRWMARLLNERAESAENNQTANSVVISPHDLPQIALKDWFSMEVHCKVS